MRISDWSSDVCSSDLPLLFIPELLHEGSGAGTGDGAEVVDKLLAVHADAVVGDGEGLGRSVGLEADAEGAVVAEQSRLGKRGVAQPVTGVGGVGDRSEEHTSELQSLMRISYAVFCLKKKIRNDDRDGRTHGTQRQK